MRHNAAEVVEFLKASIPIRCTAGAQLLLEKATRSRSLAWNV